MMSMVGASSAGALSDPLSMTVCTMSVEAEAISFGAETRSTIGFVNAEVVTGTSKTVTIVASRVTAAGTNSTVLGSAVKV